MAERRSRHTGRRRSKTISQRHENAGAMGRHHAALARFLPAVDAGRGRHLPPQQGQGDARRESAITDVECSPPRDGDADLPETFVDYEENPREYILSAVTTVLDVQTRISDLYSSPNDQIQEQLRLAHREGEGAAGERADQQHGLRPARQRRADRMRITTRTGAPTPDDLDELIAKVWKEPAFFLAHPRGHRRFRPRVHAPRRAAADGDAVRLAVPHLARPAAGAVRQGASRRRTARRRSCCCARARRSRASSACSSRACPARSAPSLSVRFMGINRARHRVLPRSRSTARLAVLTEDALGVLEDVEVGKYHDYPDYAK